MFGTEQKLLERLYEYCRKNNIQITHDTSEVSESTQAAFLHFKEEGKYIEHPEECIVVREGKKDNPYVLAHEIGHYLGYRNDGVSDESSANKYAYDLCIEMLEWYEVPLLIIPITTWLSGTQYEKKTRPARGGEQSGNP